MRDNYNTYFKAESVSSTTTGAGADTVFTVPLQFDAEVDLLLIASGAGTNDINIQVYHADDSTYSYILRNYTMTNNNYTTVLDGAKIYLHPGDKIVAYKNGGDFDVTVSGRLFYNPVRRN